MTSNGWPSSIVSQRATTRGVALNPARAASPSRPSRRTTASAVATLRAL